MADKFSEMQDEGMLPAPSFPFARPDPIKEERKAGAHDSVLALAGASRSSASTFASAFDPLHALGIPGMPAEFPAGIPPALLMAGARISRDPSEHASGATALSATIPRMAPLAAKANSAAPTQLATVSSDSRKEPKLENIVSTVDLDCQLELRKIALQAKNAEYNPKRFAAVIMRIKAPKTTALIFSSGKMVCTGAKTENDSRTAALKYAKTIKKLGFDVKFKKFTIQNIVGSCAVDFRVNLEELMLSHKKFCTYDPEIFPGLIYRMEKPHIVLLIFCSGKVVLTGAKEKAQLTDAFQKISPVLGMHKVQGSQRPPQPSPIPVVPQPMNTAATSPPAPAA